MTNRNQVVTGIIAGALLGSAVGLLFAPKAGRETREIVGTRSTAIKTKAGDYFSVIRNKLKRAEEMESLNGAADPKEINL